ncbi:hypothetical protein [Amycolatopsis sp. NBC_01480]|uniref:hypothetical protein n=1 Tax=Amycolatopsis sp. NBC_01480 TaxID=2903562 RepID=UPI002E2C7A26|nr:hypothetical protein [Amycolatopsis sp. NBC_01480]
MARDGGVKRVVLTSAFHAVAYGYAHTDHEFTEDDWTVLDGPGVTPSTKRKTLAERAVWDFIAAEGGATELATILPVAVMGPAMGVDPDRRRPLHTFTPVAAGQRFLVSSGPAISLKQIGAVLKGNLGDAAQRVPSRSIPDIAVRIASVFLKEFRSVVPDLGFARKPSSEKARRVLGWQPRKPEEAIIATAESLVRKQLVKA